MLVYYATGFLFGMVVACLLDWSRRRALVARVRALQHDVLVGAHDLWAARRERDAAIAERERVIALLAAELRREIA